LPLNDKNDSFKNTWAKPPARIPNDVSIDPHLKGNKDTIGVEEIIKLQIQ
jgi:hypothetical protein